MAARDSFGYASCGGNFIGSRRWVHWQLHYFSRSLEIVGAILAMELS